MIHRVIKSDSYNGDKEPVADLGLLEGAVVGGSRRHRVRKFEVQRGAHVSKPTTLAVEAEDSYDAKLHLTTKAAREVAKGLLQNMTVEEIAADQELVGVLRAMLIDINNFGE